MSEPNTLSPRDQRRNFALGGLIVDWTGFDAVMVIAAVSHTLAIGISMLMGEPRTRPDY